MNCNDDQVMTELDGFLTEFHRLVQQDGAVLDDHQLVGGSRSDTAHGHMLTPLKDLGLETLAAIRKEI